LDPERLSHLTCPYGKDGDRLLVNHGRVTLTLVDLRVQRLQEISDQDAIAEGIEMDEIVLCQLSRP
jgi:hypothetical protein